MTAELKLVERLVQAVFPTVKVGYYSFSSSFESITVGAYSIDRDLDCDGNPEPPFIVRRRALATLRGEFLVELARFDDLVFAIEHVVGRLATDLLGAALETIRLEETAESHP